MRVSSNAEIARQVLRDGGRLLDIGCGDGRFSRAVAGLFKAVSGIDINSKRIEQARAFEREAGLAIDFRVGPAEHLPYADSSFDVVTFSNSLHHVTAPAAALQEAVRVLRDGGVLYVMEPVPAGNYHEATCLVNDETVVRTAAYRELARVSVLGLRPEREIMYRARRQFVDFDAWRADQIDRDPKRKALFDAQPQEVRRRFEANAEHIDGHLAFDQVFRVNLLRRPGAEVQPSFAGDE